MRFGNNEKYLMCLVEPYNGKEKKVQTNFLKLFNDQSQLGNMIIEGLYGTKEELDDNEDFFPYICVSVGIH